MKKLYTLLLLLLNLATALAQDPEKLNFNQLDSVSSEFASQEQHDRALLYIEKMLELSSPQQDSNYVKSLNKKAWALRNMRNLPESEQIYLQALEQKNAMQSTKEHIATLNGLVELYRRMQNFEKCQAFTLKSIDFCAQKMGTQSSEYGFAVYLMGELKSEEKLLRDAEVFYLQAISIEKKAVGSTSSKYMRYINGLARTYWFMERNAEAKDLMEQVAELQKNTIGETHPRYSQTLNNLSLLYEQLGQYGRAEQALTTALAIRKTVFGEQSAEYLQSLSNLAIIYELTGRFDESEKLSLSIIKTYKQTVGENDLGYLVAHAALAATYGKQGKLDKALGVYDYMAAKYDKIFGRSFSNYQRTNISAAKLCFENKKYNEAAKYSSAAIYAIKNWDETKGDVLDSIARWDLSSDNIQIINDALLYWYNALRGIHQETGDTAALTRAYRIVNLMLQINTEIRNSFMSEEDKLGFMVGTQEVVSAALEMGLALKKASPDELFRIAELNKSVLLLDATKTQMAYRFGDLPDSLVQKEGALQMALSEAKQAVAQAKTPQEKMTAKRTLGSINLDIEQYKQEIKGKYPNYHQLKYQPTQIDLAAMQKLLGDNDLLLEYYESDTMLYIFALDQKQLKIYPLTASLKDISQHIATLRDALTNYKQIKNEPDKNYQNYTTSALWLYQNILKIAIEQSSIKANGKLIIIPDGNLGHIPFEALLTEASPEKTTFNKLPYLINQYSINYNYSASLWKDNLQSEKKKNNGAMLAFAASYTKSANKVEETEFTEDIATLRSPQLRNLRDALDDLPAAKQEVEGLSALFQGDFRIGIDANEKYFKQKAADYSVVHLAMHGILNKSQPILSSLAFTEDKDSSEDNFLEAWEISNMHLNADLVVLSACETGYGKFQQGEGIMSLARSFMYANVPALVVSLWEVNDASTSSIMQHFYKNMADGLDKPAALRQAKIQYLSETHGISQHPAYWSPFVQIGDSRPIHITKKSTGFNAWIWGAGGGVALLLLLLLIKRKK